MLDPDNMGKKEKNKKKGKGAEKTIEKTQKKLKSKVKKETGEDDIENIGQKLTTCFHEFFEYESTNILTNISQLKD